MKKMMLFLIIATFSIAVMAQTKEKEEKKEKKVEVPAVVKTAFQKDYPSVKDVKWDAEDGNFEAEFKLNGIENSANYDKAGIRLEVETAIKTDQLPKTALDYITKNYPTYKITEAAKITNSKNVVTYEAELKLGKKEMDLVFDVAGKFIREEKE